MKDEEVKKTDIPEGAEHEGEEEIVEFEFNEDGEEDLKKTYREGSWTIRQLVHHVADTHQWHFIRIKQALTEENAVGIVFNVNALAAPTSLVFATGTPTGSGYTAGGAQTVIAGVSSPINATVPFAGGSGVTGVINMSWTNPTAVRPIARHRPVHRRRLEPGARRGSVAATRSAPPCRWKHPARRHASSSRSRRPAAGWS